MFLAPPIPPHFQYRIVRNSALQWSNRKLSWFQVYSLFFSLWWSLSIYWESGGIMQPRNEVGLSTRLLSDTRGVQGCRRRLADLLSTCGSCRPNFGLQLLHCFTICRMMKVNNTMTKTQMIQRFLPFTTDKINCVLSEIEFNCHQTPYTQTKVWRVSHHTHLIPSQISSQNVSHNC